MARVSKEPLRMFRVNIRKARGVAGLQPFLDDLIKTGGRKTIGFAQDIILDSLSSAQGLTRKEFENKIGAALVKIVKPPNKRKYEKDIEAAFGDAEQQFSSLIKLFRDIRIAKSRVLLEQSVVLGVTALEVFCQDITISAVRLNTFIEKRFHQEISKKFNYDGLKKAGYAPKIAIGMTVVSSYNFYDMSSLENHFKRLTGSYWLFDMDCEKAFKRMIAHRNLIVHQGGIVDHEFKRKIKDAVEIGKPVPITLSMVNDWLDAIEEIAEKINELVVNTKDKSPRTSKL